MKNLKKLLALILGIVLCFSLFACGGSDPCTEHADENGDGKCDACGERLEKEPCETCVDSDGDGKCDKCSEAVEPEPTADIPLIVDGEVTFKIVLAKNIDGDARKYVTKNIQALLRNTYKITLDVVTEGSSDDTVTDTEVLIGDITTRGEKYEFDRYTLGKKGYIIKAIDGKIIINAGSDEQLVDTLEKFAEEILGLGNKKLENATMTSSDSTTDIQDNYKITSLSVNSTDMRGYTIAADKTNTRLYNTALIIQDTIYDRTGYHFKIVNESEATDKSVIITLSESKVYGESSFTVKAEGTKLMITSSFENATESAVSKFLTSNITIGTGAVNFEGTVYTEDISVARYDDFGAVGDGKTDDYAAIYDAHVYANECGQKVVATSGKTYYLSNATAKVDGKDVITTIPIRTDVDWTGASFIIDDTDVNTRDAEGKKQNIWMFTAESDYDVLTMKKSDAAYSEMLSQLSGIGYTNDTKKIDLGLGYPAMIIVYNENHGVYRRYGSAYEGETQQTFGSAQHELLVIDKYGNISSDTPFMFDYDEVTKIEVLRLDITPITLKGGDFTTLSCRHNAEIMLNGKKSSLGYYKRGIMINRSFTTIDGVSHYIEGEFTLAEYESGLKTTMYQGFYATSNATDVTYKNCVLTGRKNHVGGTYDFNATCVNNLIVDSCTQSNFWIDDEGNGVDYNSGRGSMDSVDLPSGGKLGAACFGVTGTNFCKNFSFINSRLSRLDAHQGLYNGSIINSEVQYIEIIGKGTFTFKDSKIYLPESYANNSLFYLRGDYGSTWEGTLIVDNVSAYVRDGDFYIFYHSFANFDFGYTCYIPNIEISDLTVYSKASGQEQASGYGIKMFNGSMEREPYMHTEDLGGKGENANPTVAPEYIKIATNEKGYAFKLPYQPAGHFLADTKYYSGDREVEYKRGSMGHFTFY